MLGLVADWIAFAAAMPPVAASIREWLRDASHGLDSGAAKFLELTPPWLTDGFQPAVSWATIGLRHVTAWAAAVGDLDLAPPVLLVVVHVLSCLLVALGIAMRRRAAASPGFLLLAIANAAMGPVGAFGALLTIGLRPLFAWRAAPFEVRHASLYPQLQVTRPRLLYERLRRGGGPPKRSVVAPFVDVMALGAVSQKQAVIGVIADEFRPAFATALRCALNDAEPAIRVQAATAFARIEGRFLSQSMALDTRISEHPNDPDAILRKARHHESYAESGLLDSGRAMAEWEAALACYERLELQRPGDPAIVEAAARVLLRLDRTRQAVCLLQHYLAGYGGKTATGNASLPATQTQPADSLPGILNVYLEALYRFRDFRRLRSACDSIASAAGARLGTEAPAALWSGRLPCPAILPAGTRNAGR